MSAYMDLNSVPATGNLWLMREVLRKDWGFKGFVVSDWDAIKSLQVHGFRCRSARCGGARFEGRNQYGDDEQQLSREFAGRN